MTYGGVNTFCLLKENLFENMPHRALTPQYATVRLCTKTLGGLNTAHYLLTVYAVSDLLHLYGNVK